MKLVKFRNTYYGQFITSKEVTVDLVLSYLNDNYSNVGRFVPDPDNKYIYLDYVYNEEYNTFLYFDESYIEER